MRQTRSQTIAAAAYHCINERKNLAAAKKKKYKTLVLNLPAMIMQNGLTQTTGFLLAKGEAEHEQLLHDLCRVLQEMNTALKQQTLHENLLASDALQYMQLTRHALQAAGYLRRFTQGIFLDDDSPDKVAGSDNAIEERR